MTAEAWGDVSLVAVDIGNTRTKIGGFNANALSRTVPEPHVLMDFETNSIDLELLENTLPACKLKWIVGSVHSAAQTTIADWVDKHRPSDEYNRVTHRQISLAIDVDHPDRVGIDRLLACVAANRLRREDETAVVVTVGTAITVNVLDAGRFIGGAILPGIHMSAKALGAQTDALPTVTVEATESPPRACGRNTEAAIRSGLYWGAVGGIRELISQLAEDIVPENTFFTGGDAASLTRQFDQKVVYRPHLVLSGAALCSPR